MKRLRSIMRPRSPTGDAEAPESENTIYIHLASDGGILVIRGDSGEELWVDDAGLRRELNRIKGEPGASLLYSREAGQQEPPPEVFEIFQVIVDYELPIQLLEQPHPSALVPPAERRDLTRGD